MTEYIHGTAASEQERLSTLNQLMNHGSLREARINPGERIVDFGSGLGQLSLAMARAAGAKLVGIERSAEQLEKSVRHELLDLRQGSAEEPPLRSEEWGSFDVAHARFILEDDDHDILRLYPPVPGLAELWAAYMRTYDRIGCDPYVGRRLPSLLHEAGARPVRSTFIFFGACHGEPQFAALVENLAGVLESARGTIPDPPDFDGTLARLRAWSKGPEASIGYAIFWAEGVRQ